MVVFSQQAVWEAIGWENYNQFIYFPLFFSVMERSYISNIILHLSLFCNLLIHVNKWEVKDIITGIKQSVSEWIFQKFRQHLEIKELWSFAYSIMLWCQNVAAKCRWHLVFTYLRLQDGLGKLVCPEVVMLDVQMFQAPVLFTLIIVLQKSDLLHSTQCNQLIMVVIINNVLMLFSF